MAINPHPQPTANRKKLAEIAQKLELVQVGGLRGCTGCAGFGKPKEPSPPSLPITPGTLPKTGIAKRIGVGGKKSPSSVLWIREILRYHELC